jgi:outer membrane receptor protein involved in Fe transport
VDEFDQQGESDRYRAAFKSVDVSLSYEFKNGWKIFIEGNNVTSEPVDVRYFETPNWLATYDQDGSRWTAGITARF